MRSRVFGCLAAVVFLVVTVDCSAPPRAQLVVFLDTDAAPVGQIALDPTISSDAAIDTVRVDVLDENDSVVDLRTFDVSDVASWPLSFGVLPNDSGEVRLRVRLFRASFASAGTTAGSATLDPPARVTIERLAHIAVAPTLTSVALFLTEDCLGTPSTFGGSEATCIDASHLTGDPTDGILAGGVSATQAGTWMGAFETPCTATRSGATCIPGGFSILGELSLAGSSDQHGYEPVPLRPAIVTPFLLDTAEYTVGQFRALLGKTSFAADMPTVSNGTNPATSNFCTWLGPTESTNDKFPLNCVSYAAAALVCKLEGGGLPTEAEWEHAARGRGLRSLHPWGDADAKCCSASLSRQAEPGYFAACTGEGVEPIGAHPPSACGGLGDTTRDGILDMQGSLAEAAADDLDPYDAPCWSALGVPIDPICKDPASAGYAERGGSWVSDLSVELPSRFLWNDDGFADGFRCRYPGAP